MDRNRNVSLIPAWLPPDSRHDAFPSAHLALRDPNGLLAMGGDLHPQRLMYAYANGIFPWYSDEHPILWWSPDPRFVIYPGELKISRSLSKTIRQGKFRVTCDQSFEQVIRGCAAPRASGDGTWINQSMLDAYCELHRLGHAMSVECWCGDQLAGGLYGIRLGRVFFGESMFSRVRDASKVALATLCKKNFALIDCQLPNEHLIGLGARGITRQRFLSEVAQFAEPSQPGSIEK